MTLTLELSRDLERRLTTEAARLGLPVEQYALRLLGDTAPRENRPTTGAELVAFWQREGIIGSRPEIADSQAHARALRSRAERRLRG
jgi:predicted nucleic acid-binding protein